MYRRWIGVVLPASSIVAVALQSPTAGAQGAAAAAQVLFEQGRDLLREGNIAEACPKLAESHRLDPATGTLLALAACHEAEGKLASAWAEFSEVVARAHRDGQPERERWAKERVAALRPRLSSLELQLPLPVQQLPALEVKRNGIRLEKAAWNVSVPVDGGRYVVEVSASGYQTWRTELAIEEERDAQIVLVPRLSPHSGPADARPLDPNATVAAPSALQPAQADQSRGWSTLQWVGAAGGGVGLAALVTGGVLSYAAVVADNEAEACGQACPSRQRDAYRFADAATVFVASGAALLVAGGALLLWGGNDAESRIAQSVQLDVTRHGGTLRFSLRY